AKAELRGLHRPGTPREKPASAACPGLADWAGPDQVSTPASGWALLRPGANSAMASEVAPAARVGTKQTGRMRRLTRIDCLPARGPAVLGWVARAVRPHPEGPPRSSAKPQRPERGAAFHWERKFEMLAPSICPAPA